MSAVCCGLDSNLNVMHVKNTETTSAVQPPACGRAFSRVCLSVCLFDCTRKGKWLDLSALKLVDI